MWDLFNAPAIWARSAYSTACSGGGPRNVRMHLWGLYSPRSLASQPAELFYVMCFTEESERERERVCASSASISTDTRSIMYCSQCFPLWKVCAQVRSEQQQQQAPHRIATHLLAFLTLWIVSKGLLKSHRQFIFHT